MEKQPTIAFTSWTNTLATLSYATAVLGLAWTIYAKCSDWQVEKRKRRLENAAEAHRT